MVAAFSQDISVFLSLLYTSEVYFHCWNVLEAYPNQAKAHLLAFVRSEEDNPLGPVPSNISLHDHPLWGLSKHLLLLGCILVGKWGLRPNIRVQVFAPHNSPSKILIFPFYPWRKNIILTCKVKNHKRH